jgi:hypothetical protein
MRREAMRRSCGQLVLKRGVTVCGVGRLEKSARNQDPAKTPASTNHMHPAPIQSLSVFSVPILGYLRESSAGSLESSGSAGDDGMMRARAAP